MTEQLLLSAGIAAFIAVLVNLLKVVKWIKPEGEGWFNAGRASTIFNLVAFVAGAVLGLVRPDFDLAHLDGLFAQAAEALYYVGLFAAQVIASPLVHQELRKLNIPGISKSFSKEQ